MEIKKKLQQVINKVKSQDEIKTRGSEAIKKLQDAAKREKQIREATR